MEREGLPPGIKYHSNAVITGAGRRVNSAFGGLSILGDFIDLAVRKRPARGRAGKRRSSTADRRLQTEAKASPISPTGPLVLDCAVRRVEGLAASLVHRSS